MFRKTLFASLAFAITALAAHPGSKASLPSLVGSWELTFTPATSTTPLGSVPGLATFTSDNTVVETDGSELASVPASTGALGVGSPGHGIWQHGGAVVTLYVQYFSVVVTQDGALLEKNITTWNGVTIEKSASGTTTLSGTYTTQTVSPAGVVGRTVTGKITGTLITHPAVP